VLPTFIDGSRPTEPYYEPETWEETLKRGPTPPGRSASAPSTAGVRYTRGAPPTEELDDRSLVQYVDGRWRPWTPLPEGVLPIAPQTCLADDLEAGDTSVPVCSLASLFEESGSGGQQWFAVGDRVAIDLRGDDPWITTVTAVSDDRLTFASAAPADHLPGTAVHLLPAPVGPTTTTSTTASPTAPPTTIGAPLTSGDGDGVGSVDDGQLARTGSSPLPWVAGSLAAIVLGIVALTRSRRLRRS
jgi:hypothetical protein